jgi:hypothetical protein
MAVIQINRLNTKSLQALRTSLLTILWRATDFSNATRTRLIRKLHISPVDFRFKIAPETHTHLRCKEDLIPLPRALKPLR